MTNLLSALETWRSDAEIVLDGLRKAPRRQGEYKERFRDWNRTAKEVQNSSEQLSDLLYQRRKEFKNRNITIEKKVVLIEKWEQLVAQLGTILTGIVEQHAQHTGPPARSVDQMKREAHTATESLIAVRQSMSEVLDSIDDLIEQVRNQTQSAASITRLEVRVDTTRFHPPDDLLPGVNDAS